MMQLKNISQIVDPNLLKNIPPMVDSDSMKRIKKLANIFSWIFHPLWMPTAGVALFYIYTYLYIMSPSYKLFLIAVTATFTLFIPAGLMTYLRHIGAISDLEISNKKERPIPYLLVILSYAACLFILWRINTPIWVTAYILGGVLSLSINSLITFFWKISAHMAGIGALAGSVFALCHLQEIYPRTMLMIIVLVSGLLGSARVVLKHHTLMQVVMGFASGFLATFISIITLVYLK